MAAAVAGTACASVAATGGTITLIKLITMSKIKIALVGAFVVAALATPWSFNNISLSPKRSRKIWRCASAWINWRRSRRRINVFPTSRPTRCHNSSL